MDIARAVAHFNYLQPTTLPFQVQNFDRLACSLQDLRCVTSGTLRLIAVALPSGLRFSFVAFLSGTTALSGGKNQWAVLLSETRLLQQVSADRTSSAWARTGWSRSNSTPHTPYELRACSTSGC